jgi:deoxyribose-phosphate aldolase
MKCSSYQGSYQSLSSKELASMIEHTILGDNLDEDHIIAHCNEAIELDVFGVCLPLAWVPLARKHLKNSNKKIITVIDFPLGQQSSEEKVRQAQIAKMLGVDEVDMVLDHGALCQKNYLKALNDIVAVVANTKPLPIKVIVETGALSREQLSIACALVALSGAQFIKTSTGFHAGGARVEDVLLMRSLLPDSILIKASGGIKNFSSAFKLIEAGAARIGASRTKDILKDC